MRSFDISQKRFSKQLNLNQTTGFKNAPNSRATEMVINDGLKINNVLV